MSSCQSSSNIQSDAASFPRWADAHCHLADQRISSERLKEMIERSKEAGIPWWVQGGICPQDWDRQLEIQRLYGPGIIPCFGLHPWWVSQADRHEIEKGLKQLENRLSQAHGLGELGLDHADRFDTAEVRSKQENAFNLQLQIARSHGKPVILHIVKAHAQAIKILEKNAPFPNGGIIHSFSSSIEIAKEYMNMGFLISIGGAITRNGFKGLKTAVKAIPYSKIVVETDSPDQTPALSGVALKSLNEPAYLKDIARCLGQHMSVSECELLTISTRNLGRLFKFEL